jgi:hypothetical protein
MHTAQSARSVIEMFTDARSSSMKTSGAPSLAFRISS